MQVELISKQEVDRLAWEYLERPTDENVAFYEHFLELPSIIPQELKTGHWVVVEVLHGEWEGIKKYACDKCGERVGVFRSNYCPNCGAKMESEDKE